MNDDIRILQMEMLKWLGAVNYFNICCYATLFIIDFCYACSATLLLINTYVIMVVYRRKFEYSDVA